MKKRNSTQEEAVVGVRERRKVEANEWHRRIWIAYRGSRRLCPRVAVSVLEWGSSSVLHSSELLYAPSLSERERWRLGRREGGRQEITVHMTGLQFSITT